MFNPHELKRNMVRICHLLAEKDYVSAMDGNVSARLPDGNVLSTPTMVHKGFITEKDLLIVDPQGRKIEGDAARRPTSEIFMHLAIYAQRPDIHAVVHAHPPTAIAFTLAGEGLARCVLPEVVLTLGQIPTTEYHTAGSRALADAVGELIQTHDALLLDRHGAICAGCDLVDAFGKMEKVEHTAIITHKARMLGRVRELECEEVDTLRQMGSRYSSRGQRPPSCEGCDGCPSSTPWQEAPSFPVGRIRLGQGTKYEADSASSISLGTGLERIITEEVVRALKDRQQSR